MLNISNLKAAAGGRRILTGVDLTVKPGELVVLMGPNGSGKSTLAYVLAGHPGYSVAAGSIRLDGCRLNSLSPDERAGKGLFLGFQYPVAVAGVDIFNLLKQAYDQVKRKKTTPLAFRKLAEAKAKILGLNREFIGRSVNDGFSGGERKKSEIFQLAVLAPKYAVLDEIDSGLDIDAVKTVAKAISRVRRDNPRIGILLITHYRRILDYLTVNRVAVMKAGRIAGQGGQRLISRLEKNGYAGI